VTAVTVSEALSEYFSRSPEVKGYVLTDAGGLRKHIAVFVDGVRIEDDGELRDGGKSFEVLGEGCFRSMPMT
jgi:hypothetical protein